MKSFVVLSTMGHGLLVAGFIGVGTFLAKPKATYYAVNLFDSGPSGGGAAAIAESPTPVAPPTAIKAPKAAPVIKSRAPAESVVKEEEEAPDQDTLRMLAKLKKKRLAMASGATPAPVSSARAAASPTSGTSGSAGRNGAGGTGTGSGLVADAGPAFPYPWYLKAIADRLDKQWHPPKEFESDTLCQVTFNIDRSGQISDANVSKSSGDNLFDQLAMRAVLYANPLPPLPNGFPDDILKVHMKFVGRRF